MKVVNCEEDTANKELYIPHGSDERKAVIDSEKRNNPLYPTWFR